MCIFIDKELFEERLNHLMMEENQHYLMEGSGRNFFLVSERNAVLNEGDIVSTREQDGWVLKTWIDKDTAYAPVNMLLRILMLELLILLGISVGLAVFLSGRITRPMRKIETAMQQIGEGNMDIVVQDQDQDEMGILAATLNNMSLNIKELMAQIHRDEEQKRYLQLKAMQYQVNPHFLYNTLDSIAMSARRNNDSTSEKMALALSEFFRLSLSHGMEYVTVSEEMRYVQSYLEIQSMRFPDSVTWECRIEPGLENIKVLKFILQPLAENSLYHGLRDSGREGHIDVSAYAVNEDLIFSVKDNGAGMLPEQLEKLKEEINCRQATEKSIYEGGFGLQNVQQRLQLPAVKGGLGGLCHQGEVGDQGGGLLYRVVLAEGDKVDVLTVEQAPQVGGRGGESVVGRGRDEHGPAVAQVRLSRHGDAGVGDAGGQLPQGISRTGGNNQQVQQLLGSNGLRLLDGGDDPVVADAHHLPHQVVGVSKAGILRRRVLGDNGDHMGKPGPYLFQSLHSPAVGTEGAAHCKSDGFLIRHI